MGGLLKDPVWAAHSHEKLPSSQETYRATTTRSERRIKHHIKICTKFNIIQDNSSMSEDVENTDKNYQKFLSTWTESCVALGSVRNESEIFSSLSGNVNENGNVSESDDLHLFLYWSCPVWVFNK